MASVKKVLSIYLDVRRELKTVYATLSKGKVVIESFDHAMLVTQLEQHVAEHHETAEGEPGLEDAGDVFGIEEEHVEISEDNLFGESGEGDEDDADMAAEGVDEDEVTNEDVLLGLIQRVADKKYSIAINIPAPLLSVLHVREDITEMKPKPQAKFVHEHVEERLDKSIPKDHLAYLAAASGGAVAFTYEGNIPLITACEALEDSIDAKTKFVLSDPDEISLINLLRLNEKPEEEEVIAIIDMEETTTRVIVTKGGVVVHVPPHIPEGTESQGAMNVIYSKILYEQDIGNMPDFNKIVLSGESRDVNAKEFLQEKFADVEVDYLTIKTDKIVIPEELTEDVPEYAVPLGLAINALLPKDEDILHINMLPDYVKARQKAFKLAWHGMILLLLIFSSPFILNWQYNDSAATKLVLNQQKTNIEHAIADLEWAEPLLDSISTRMAMESMKYELIDSFSRGTLKFSNSLSLVNEAIRTANNLWLTDITTTREGFGINGFSMYRNRVHRFASQFAEANIRTVSPAYIRGKQVYKFEIEVIKMVENDSLFNPVVVIPEEELEPDPVPIEIIEEVVEEVDDTPVIEIPIETFPVEDTTEIVIPEIEYMDLLPGTILPDYYDGGLFTVELPPDYIGPNDTLYVEEDLSETVYSTDITEIEEEPVVVEVPTSVGNISDLGIVVDNYNLPLLYNEAHDHFVNHEYEAALELFLAITGARLNDSLSDNAQYWLGECYLALGSPSEAIKVLEQLFELYPDTNKGEPALLLLGKAYAQNGEEQIAKDILTRMLSDHSPSEFTKKASRILERLNKE